MKFINSLQGEHLAIYAFLALVICSPGCSPGYQMPLILFRIAKASLVSDATTVSGFVCVMVWTENKSQQ